MDGRTVGLTDKKTQTEGEHTDIQTYGRTYRQADRWRDRQSEID